MANGKPRLAFFDFACCEGCQLHVLEMGETLLQMLENVEVVAWREVMTGEADYDIAICEGSVTRESDIERMKKIRETADIVVSLGTCASIGCHNALKNRWSMDELLELVYGEQGRHFDTIPARPITAVVDVDYQTFGCPVSLPDFVTVFNRILTGQDHAPSNQPVCVECKLSDNVCVFEKGKVCLGPVTRCGCDAICTRYGDGCNGCRGVMDAANLDASIRVLTGDRLHAIMQRVVELHRMTEEEVRAKLGVYNSWPENQPETLPHTHTEEKR
jgi:coenzyme F420-reducing hydrogenase gamma subunit